MERQATAPQQLRNVSITPSAASRWGWAAEHSCDDQPYVLGDVVPRFLAVLDCTGRELTLENDDETGEEAEGPVGPNEPVVVPVEGDPTGPLGRVDPLTGLEEALEPDREVPSLAVSRPSL